MELDVSSGELRRDGLTTQLQGQPLQVLLLLIERAGDIVTREEIQRRVWSDETFVDFEHGLNSIVKRLCEALGDSAEHPVLVGDRPAPRLPVSRRAAGASRHRFGRCQFIRRETSRAHLSGERGCEAGGNPMDIRGRLRRGARGDRFYDSSSRSDPLLAAIADILGSFAYYRDDNAVALQRMQDASELEGNPTKVHLFRACPYAQAGNCAEAVSALRPWALDPETLRLAESAYAPARCEDRAAVADLEQTLLTRAPHLLHRDVLFRPARDGRVLRMAQPRD